MNSNALYSNNDDLIAEWEVDKITAHRTINGLTEYQVRWVGWDASGDTWEPVENLQNAQDILQNYCSEIGENSSKSQVQKRCFDSPVNRNKRQKSLQTLNNSTTVSALLSLPSISLEVQSPSDKDIDSDIGYTGDAKSYSDSDEPTIIYAPLNITRDFSNESDDDEEASEVDEIFSSLQFNFLDESDDSSDSQYYSEKFSLQLPVSFPDESDDNSGKTKFVLQLPFDLESNLSDEDESSDSESSADSEESLVVKKSMGPRAATIFGEIYSKFYSLDETMTCGNHKHNFSDTGKYTANIRQVGEQEFDETSLNVGDSVQIIWDESESNGDCVSSQTFLGLAAKILHPRMLFVSSQCCCSVKSGYSGWLPFNRILRTVRICYADSLLPSFDFFVPFYYDVDDFYFSNVPAHFLDAAYPQTPNDLCHCPNSLDPADWPVFSHDTDQAYVQKAYALEFTKKRYPDFVPGRFFHIASAVSMTDTKTDVGSVLDGVIEIIAFDCSDSESPVLTFRKFERPEKSIYVNELVWTDSTGIMTGWEQISRISTAECFVEFWNGESRSLAVIYRGSGLRFFFKNKATSGSYPPKGLERRNLKIVDMFCGTGNFSKGVVDSNLGKMKHALDLCPDAVASFNTIHSHKVGQEGDINSYLRKIAINARKNPCISVADVILASPPCQDFTIMNRKTKERGRAIIVDVANIVECVPNLSYLVVENVSEFARSRQWREEAKLTKGLPPSKKVTMFERLLVHLISFGYQLRFEILNSGFYGSPQDRNRLILIAAAKDKPLPNLPTPSHFFHDKTRSDKFIKTSCTDGQPGKRPISSAPCRHITIQDRIGDLTGRGSSKKSTKKKSRQMPLHYKGGRKEEFAWQGQRASWDALFKTITMNPIPHLKFRYHPSERRDFTLRECGLAQGFSSRDLALLESFYKKRNDGKNVSNEDRKALSKQIGNAVPRELAFAIGCAIANSI
ncbi:uroporphyrin-III C-methyltransferase [Physocladia obscura]|uniref:DNA (cytosine-5-)-methyltransferase n=1 Tax=Physocladia obscura TaxID=109957 RepID=A0AAD5TB64_9FUNG|nr:uroporphyrin-III C-methyltransferase [Physocladia obscura]